MDRTSGSRTRLWLTLGGVIASLVVVGIAGRILLGSRGGDTLRRAEAAYRAGEWKNASAFVKEWLVKSPEDLDALKLYARSLARQGRDDSAMALYNGRLKGSSMQEEDLILLGQILERSGNLELAFNVRSKAVTEFPKSGELRNDLTRLAFQMQRLDVAQANAEQLSRLPGWETKGTFWLGVVQATLGDLAGGTKYLEEALNRDPKATAAAFPEFQYRRQLAQILLQQGKPAPAIEQLNRIEEDARAHSREFDPHSAWLLSRAYLQESKLEEARAALAATGSFRKDRPYFPEPSPYTGEARCMKCHVDIGKAHAATRHARTFHHGQELHDLPLPKDPLADPDESDVKQALIFKDGKLEAETRVDDKVYRSVVDYAVGTVNRYFSLVMKDQDGHYRVFRLSYYTENGQSGWGRSSGDGGNDDRIQRVRGQTVHVQDSIVRCVACHVTNARNFAETTAPKDRGPEANDHGIGCERCHGPGANHEKAMDLGFSDHAIASPTGMSAEAVTKVCAECHIVGSRDEIQKAPNSEMWVRSPGLTMTFSRCYTESQGDMSCLTCHDPHRDAEKSPAYYEAKCLKCHDVGRPNASPKSTGDHLAGRGAVCKVNPKTDCLNCHMPKIQVPVLHTSLTDHFIRVREKTDK